jgi:hypothetical protein
MKSKSRSQSFRRPRLELLEDRVQPSVLLQQPSGIVSSAPLQAAAFSALTPIQAGGVDLQLDHQTGGAQAPAINVATYVTGTSNSASGGGVAVDANDNQYVAGSVVVNATTGATAGFIAKYLPHSVTLDTTFNPTGDTPGVVMYQPTFSMVQYNLAFRGVAVDSRGNVDAVGVATNPNNGVRLALFGQWDSTGTRTFAVGYGSLTDTTHLYAFDGIAADGMGDVFFTGTFWDGSNQQLAFGLLPDGSTTTIAGSYGFTGVTSTGGHGIAVDGGANFGYVAGELVPSPVGPKQGLAGRINLQDIGFQITAFGFQGNFGDLVLSGAAVAGSGRSYFAGTVAADTSGGIAALILQFDSGFMYDADHSVAFQLLDDQGNTHNANLSAAAVDLTGNVYVTGAADPDTPTPGVLVVKLDSTLNLDTSSLDVLGGDGSDIGASLAVNGDGSISVVGTTTSANFPVTDGSTLHGTADAFLLNYSFT